MIMNGALIGRLMGLVFVDAFGAKGGSGWLDPGTFAVLGSAGFFAGVSRSTLPNLALHPRKRFQTDDAFNRFHRCGACRSIRGPFSHSASDGVGPERSLGGRCSPRRTSDLPRPDGQEELPVLGPKAHQPFPPGPVRRWAGAFMPSLGRLCGAPDSYAFITLFYCCRTGRFFARGHR